MFYLLTHERELHRPSNTGTLALNHSADFAKRVVWQRTQPDDELVALIESSKAVLLHSSAASADTPSVILEDFENFIIIDSTWQESRKILNRSPYLQKAPKAALHLAKSSTYKLRRNQTDQGFCTIECIIEVLRCKGQSELADELHMQFEQFNNSLE